MGAGGGFLIAFVAACACPAFRRDIMSGANFLLLVTFLVAWWQPIEDAPRFIRARDGERGNQCSLHVTRARKACAGEPENVRTSTEALGAISAVTGCGFTSVATVHVAAFEQPLLRMTTWL